MPRLNYGTLLENVVTLEVARLCFDLSAAGEAMAFATAFAMPPLTQCWTMSMTEQNNSPVFNDTFLSQLAGGQNTPQTLREAWAICLSNRPALPVCCLRVAQPENCLYNNA